MKKNLCYIIFPIISTLFISCSHNNPDISRTEETSETLQTEPAETQISNEIYEGCTITFEDGFLWTAECIGDKNFEDDEAECILSTVDFEGSRQLKIEVLSRNKDGEYKVPKIRFDVDKLIGINNVSRIKSVSLDMTATANGMFTADNGDEIFVPGNCMGQINANSGENCAVWTTLAEFEFSEWEESSVKKHITGNILLPKSRYIDGETGCTLVMMRWPIPNSADIYIDNITFYDDEGNPLALVYNPTEENVSATEESENI